jgi:transcriptional regulator with XRE-family HTH domain
MLDLVKMKKLREDLGLSQREAAELAGMGSGQQWYAVESGTKSNVSLDTLGKIAKALGVDAADLLVKAKKPAKGK